MRSLPHQLSRALVLVTLGLGLARAAHAQQFLLTVQDGNSYFHALLDRDGVVLATTDPPSPGWLTPARFYRGGTWASHDGSAIDVRGPYGQHLATVHSINGWNSLATFEDGRTAVREPWTTSSVFVLDPKGAVLSKWFFQPCPAGPDYGLRVGPDGDVWLAEVCGSTLRRYSVDGTLLAELFLPGGVDTTWDDSCDDFVPDPDGTIWVRQGYDPAFVVHYDWSGTLLGTFGIPKGTSGIAVDAGGRVWAHDTLNDQLVEYDPSGVTLGATPYQPGWSVWSIEVVSPEPAGESTCGPANPNSTGVPGTLAAGKVGGSPHLELTASDLPVGEPGLFLVARSAAFVPGFGGGSGNLCLGGPLGRFEPWTAGADGRARATIDLGALPFPSGDVAAHPGETWFFQAWHRDHDPAPTSNLTDGLALTLE